MNCHRRWTASRSIGLTVATVVLGMFPLAAMPTQTSNGIALNEEAAISILRSIAAAQAEFKSAVDIDTDCDGIGEYGYFAELAGTVPMRVSLGVPCTPAAGGTLDYLNPPLLRSAFGIVNGRCVTHRGYLFQLWLPAATAVGKVSAIAEDLTGGNAAAPFPGSDNDERMWCCYAWPVTYNQTGRRAFFINQRGAVLVFANRNASPFAGTSNPPRFDEAFEVLGDMSSPLRIGTLGGTWSIWWLLH